MKLKQLITALLCSVAITASAQTEKGKNLIRGTVSYSNADSKGDNSNGKNYSIILSPSYGYFVHNNLAIGVMLGYGYTKQSSENEGYFSTPTGYVFTTSHQTGVAKVYYGGPFIRHYLNIADRFKIYNQFSGNIGKGTQTLSSQFSTFESKYTSYGASINSGLTFFPIKKLAVELGFDLISYNNAKTTNQTDGTSTTDRSNAFNIGFNSFNPSIGVNFHF